MVTQQRFALIGSGFIGQVHAASLANHPAVELRAVVDVDPARSETVARRFNSRSASLEAVLLDKQIDAVLIASATPTHATILEQAARAGKAIYCEKPIDLSLDRAREAARVALSSEVPVTIGFNRRFDHSHQQLKQLVMAGDVGQPELIQMVCRASEMPPVSYLQASGGQMRDQAIHFFDLLRWLTGDEVTCVAAMGAALALPEIAAFSDVDTSTVMLRLQQGALAQLDNTRRTGHGYDERISILGSRGVAESASQTRRGATLWQGEQVTQPGLPADWFSRVQETYSRHLDAFVRQLNGETVTDLPGLLDGLQAQAIAEAATQSLNTRQFVTVEPLTWDALR